MIKPIKIHGVEIPNNIFLAPLAGYTDTAMRRLCKDMGAGLTVTEMVSAKGLVYKSKKTAELLKIAVNETPSCVQIFGSDKAAMAEAIACDKLAQFDIIDINMGCPVRKVVNAGEGSALLKDLHRAAAIVETCARATSRPVSVKIRLGFEEGSFVASEAARVLYNSGAAMLTVHGRTAKQMYGGRADWDRIAEVAAAVPIPVIGNGDIKSKEDAMNAIANFGVDGVMIGRGAVGHPEIFAQILGREYPDRKTLILIQLGYMEEYFRERYITANIRKHLHFYFKGLEGGRKMRERINNAHTISEFREIILSADE